jgi:hypothetical protein
MVYIAALLCAAYRVYTSIEGQRREAEQELNELQSLIVQGGSGFFLESFREELNKKIAGCKVLQGIIITGSQGDITFERERGGVIQWNNQSPRFIPRFGYISLKARQADIPGLRNVNIYSVINTLNYDSLIRILKQTLAAILGALLVSFITMIVTSILKTNLKTTSLRDAEEYTGGETDPGGQEPGETADFSPDPDDFSGFSPPAEDTEAEEDFDDFDGFTETADFPENNAVPKAADTDTEEFEIPDFDDLSEEPEAGQSGEDGFQLDDFFDEAELELPPQPAPTPATDSAAPSQPPASGPDSPNGLYSPRSDIGWEAYTHDRLASELHRCAASEQDLTVLILKCADGVNCDGKLYKKLAGEAVDFFNLRDLSFENGDRGITVIIPHSDLDNGIIKAEEFHSRILKNCFEAFHAKSDFLIGLSSRSGRLIEADRLLREASKALEKAQFDEGSPVVAFKSDPEKYREYIRKGG